MRYFKIRYAATFTALGFVLFGANLGMAESDRSQLLTRTFDSNYIVKYLGLEAYTIYDGSRPPKPVRSRPRPVPRPRPVEKFLSPTTRHQTFNTEGEG